MTPLPKKLGLGGLSDPPCVDAMARQTLNTLIQHLEEREDRCCGGWSGGDAYDCDRDGARTTQGVCPCKCHQPKEATDLHIEPCKNPGECEIPNCYKRRLLKAKKEQEMEATDSWEDFDKWFFDIWTAENGNCNRVRWHIKKLITREKAEERERVREWAKKEYAIHEQLSKDIVGCPDWHTGQMESMQNLLEWLRLTFTP